MSNRETNFEQNLGPLLKASCSAEVDVTPAAQERLRDKITFMIPHQLRPVEFPEYALGFLTALILLPFAAWTACAWTGAAGLAGRGLSGPILALVVVNVISIPVASVVIVLRRKYV